jgi:DNA-binding NarL/FixJ family response regulator
MTTPTIKIAIADDHTAVRQAFEKALSVYDFLSVIFVAENGADLIEKLQYVQPDVLLLDINMPRLSGIEALKIIHHHYPDTRILILTAFSDEVYVAQCLEYGINGFLTKTMDIVEIVKAIEAAYNNEVFYTNLLNNPLLKHYVLKRKKAVTNLLPDFSNEELKILNLLQEEKNTDEISDRMNLSKRSVELKRDKMRQKANVKTIGGLLLYALKRNLIQ